MSNSDLIPFSSHKKDLLACAECGGLTFMGCYDHPNSKQLFVKNGALLRLLDNILSCVDEETLTACYNASGFGVGYDHEDLTNYLMDTLGG